jgi:purine nucleoside phosphorylase
MRLGVILTSHATKGGSLEQLVDDAQLAEFTSIGLTVVSKDQTVKETTYGNVTVLIVVFEQPPTYPVIGRGLQHTIIFLQRHDGTKEYTPAPHKINHHANVSALADQQVDAIVTTSCVGTLVASFPPGRVGLARQYIDFTGVPCTFHEDDAKFTSVTQPFDKALSKQLAQVLRKVQSLDESVRLSYTYWLATGPQYETEAEVVAIDRLGGEVCGFTMPREAKLCAELSIPYAAMLVATNWAAGRHPGDNAKPLSHDEHSEFAAKRFGVTFSCLAGLFEYVMQHGSAKLFTSRKRARDDGAQAA